MKKIMLLVIVLATIIGCTKVPAGYVGVKVYLLGSSKGVDQEVLSIGRYWIGVNEDLYLFPLFMQNVRWTESETDFSPSDEAVRFQDKNIMTLTADVGFSYTLDSKKIPTLFQRHRKGIEEITGVYLRNIIQNSFNVIGGNMEFSDINGPMKSIFLEKVKAEISRAVGDEGFIIEKVTLLDLRPPKDVMQSISEKMKAQQDAQKAKAEAEAVITTAKGEAEAMRLRQLMITPNLIQYEAIKKWDGKLPNVSGGAVPFINVK